MLKTDFLSVVIYLWMLNSVSCNNCAFSHEEWNQCHENGTRLRSLCNQRKWCYASEAESCRCLPCSDKCKNHNETDCFRYCPKLYKTLKQTTSTYTQPCVGQEEYGSSMKYFWANTPSIAIIIILIIILILTCYLKNKKIDYLTKKDLERGRIIDHLRNANSGENESHDLLTR